MRPPSPTTAATGARRGTGSTASSSSRVRVWLSDESGGTPRARAGNTHRLDLAACRSRRLPQSRRDQPHDQHRRRDAAASWNSSGATPVEPQLPRPPAARGRPRPRTTPTPAGAKPISGGGRLIRRGFTLLETVMAAAIGMIVVADRGRGASPRSIAPTRRSPSGRTSKWPSSQVLHSIMGRSFTTLAVSDAVAAPSDRHQRLPPGPGSGSPRRPDRLRQHQRRERMLPNPAEAHAPTSRLCPSTERSQPHGAQHWQA
jgi:hypothetical protein